MISVVMPSYLGEYSNAATNRPYKLRRAIESFLSQGVGELVIVPDGCLETLQIASEYPVRCIDPIPKRTLFSGELRNIGIKEARFDYIAYLDSDDEFGDGHLKAISENLDAEWLWWDDFVVEKKRTVELKQGSIGTSAIAHKKALNVSWGDGYGHDWWFVCELMGYQGRKIETNYRVMHVPGYVDA